MMTTASWHQPPEHVLCQLGLLLEPARGYAHLPLSNGVFTAEGYLRLGVVAALVDSTAGAIGVLAARPHWLVTSFLDVRMWSGPSALSPGGVLTAHGVVLRGGRTSYLLEVALDAGGVVGHATIGFAALPVREGDPVMPDPPESGLVQLGDPTGLTEPLTEFLGTTPSSSGSGVTETPLGPRVRNNLGVLNGGVICMVAEEAALRAGAETFGAGAFVSQLSVSFISQVRQGPVRTEAEMLGLGLGGSVRTLVVDGGSGQVAALAMATVASTSRGASGR